MSIKSATGVSNNDNSFEAGKEASRRALNKVGGEANILIVFASVSLDQEEMLKGVNSVSGDASVVGCSSSGEIVEKGPLKEHVVVMAIASDKIKFTVKMAEGFKEDSHNIGVEVAKKIKEEVEDISLFMMFPEGLNGNGAAIIRGVKEVLGKNFPIMGGSAGDDFKFEKTYQYFQDKVLTNSVVGVGLSGDFSWGVGVKHGWDPIGIPMKVTKSEGAVLKELDGKPALSIYQEHFGASAEELIKEPLARMAYTYPLGMSVEGSDEYLIRDVVIANEDGEITCAAEIPEGREVRLMLGSREKAVVAAREAAQSAISQLKDSSPAAVFAFNCVARNKLLGEDRYKEIEAVREVVGENTPLIGFYTYGEQAPLSGDVDPSACNSVFHNETLALLILGE